MMETHNFSSGGGSSDPEVKRAESPASDCESMKSETSMDCPPALSSGPVTSDPKNETQRSASPESSCMSMKTDESMGRPEKFSSAPVTSVPNAQKTNETLESVFKELENQIISLVKNELKRFKNLLSPEYPACTERQVEDEEDQCCVRDEILKITLQVLRNMNERHLANKLQNKVAPSCHTQLKSKLREICKKIDEGISQQGTTALNDIFTELYITEGGSEEINNEHEVRQIEAASRRPAIQETSIKCSDIFRPFPGQDKSIRTMLTKGVAGIGKTVSVQKFILDWAEGRENQDVAFIFPLPFRQLNLMKEKKFSLIDLLHHFFPETKQLQSIDCDAYKVIFIFDGLDEYQLSLDFQNNESLWDVTQLASVDVLLTNLVKGNLLPSALLWITSRPVAANQIPPEYVEQVTEVRGFSDPQKEEYFRKKISDESLANKMITYMKSSRSLHIMCHIPVFCWIAATVLERMLGEAESGEIPKTLTQLFTHFLIFQIKHKERRYKKSDSDQTRKHVLALGKLAFQQLENGNLIFYEDELRTSGIDVREMSEYSGMCTQISREEFGLQQGKVFSFVHLSVQEFLAAVYVFISFISNNTNVLEPTRQFTSFEPVSMSDFLNSAVDKALKHQNGDLDLFLRFLLGLSLESNQILLRGLLTQTGSSSHSKGETITYIKKKIGEIPSPEKSINLFHCLNELNDHSLVQEVQAYLTRDSVLQGVRLSHAQWAALVFMLLNSEEKLDEFDLWKYDPSEKCLLRLLPVVKASRKANLNICGLTEESCEYITSALQKENSLLRELWMNDNDLQDSGVDQLCAGLRSSHCKLEILGLSGCGLTKQACKSLTLVLQTENSSLRELEINYNNLQDSGVEQLCAGLKSSQCKLEILRLSGCGLTEKSCKSLTLVLQKENLLKELEINNNNLLDSGVEQLSAGLKSSHCILKILRLSGCGLTEEACKSLKSVLLRENSLLRELDIDNNDLQDSGVEQLSAGLKSLQCKLEILRLSGCLVTEKGCSSLASALGSNPSHLKELDLNYNNPGESGVKLLSARLDTLRVDHAESTRMKSGVRKYVCDLTLDPNTSHALLFLSDENRKVTCVKDLQPCHDHPERFNYWSQVMSRESLSGRCYWEVEWNKKVAQIALTYKGISRKGDSGDCRFGYNLKSWRLVYSNNTYSVWHNKKETVLSAPPSSSNRVGVYLDWLAGTLSFYSVSSLTHTLAHLHTFHSTFTEPLYAGFWVDYDSSVSICKIE